jgi:hypothetical protein
MNTILRTKIFGGWLADLKDLHGKARIIKRGQGRDIAKAQAIARSLMEN